MHIFPFFICFTAVQRSGQGPNRKNWIALLRRESKLELHRADIEGRAKFAKREGRGGLHPVAPGRHRGEHGHRQIPDLTGCRL